MPGWNRCSFVAQAAGDPLEGSAPPAHRWLLLEHPGPWGRLAPADSGIDAGTVATLAEWAQAERARVVLVRRPGRRHRVPPGARRFFRVDSRPGHESIRSGVLTADTGLAAAIDAPGEAFDDALQLVCTHGRHDPCCAVRGRGLAASLAAVDGEHTWECSHLGGCRFAPVLVLLPHGFTLGAVPAAAVADVVRDYRAGMLDPRWVRGRSSLPPAVQAAQYHARAATGAVGVDALRVVGAAPVGPQEWRVEFAEPACSVLLRERWVPADRPLTCAATTPGRLRVFDLIDLHR